MSLEEPKKEKRDPGNAERAADRKKRACLDQRGDRNQDDRDLEEGRSDL
jgi:hypothetical protein